jgi:hypothetical protein
MRPRPNRQRDLFEEEEATAPIPTILKNTLVRRLGELLVDAIGDRSVKARTDDNAASEAGHEQDYT